MSFMVIDLKELELEVLYIADGMHTFSTLVVGIGEFGADELCWPS